VAAEAQREAVRLGDERHRDAERRQGRRDRPEIGRVDAGRGAIEGGLDP
jgi:hypothetical protein